MIRDDLPLEVRRRLDRVGLVIVRDAKGAQTLQVDPAPQPVIDRWTVARAAVWTTTGALGLDRGTAYMLAGVWELIELQWGRQAIDTLPNRAADLVASAAGYELGRHLRTRYIEAEP